MRKIYSDADMTRLSRTNRKQKGKNGHPLTCRRVSLGVASRLTAADSFWKNSVARSPRPMLWTQSIRRSRLARI